MGRATIRLDTTLVRGLWLHLLGGARDAEEAAFIFVRPIRDSPPRFAALGWYGVPVDGFAFSSAHHFELTDETRALVVKRAHDLDASLVEVHSHLDGAPPAFSPSDLWGFRDFVPHIWWRLKGRPYFALVVSAGGMDGLAWIDGPHVPERIGALEVRGTVIHPSRRSPLAWDLEIGGFS